MKTFISEYWGQVEGQKRPTLIRSGSCQAEDIEAMRERAARNIIDSGLTDVGIVLVITREQPVQPAQSTLHLN